MKDYGIRQDIRTNEEFEKDIQHWSDSEIEIFNIWIDQHNKVRRHKMDYVWFPWGNQSSKAFKELHMKYVKPDVLLCKLKDNQRQIDWIAPIEIQETYRPLDTLQNVYLKKHKVEMEYDKVTSQIATRGVCILFVTGSIPHERCVFISSNQIANLKKTSKAEPCNVFGGKPAYALPITSRMRKLSTPLRGEQFRRNGQLPFE